MKKLIISLALFSSLCVYTIANTDSVVISRGDLISMHLPSLKPYGDGKPLLSIPAGIPGKTEVMMWRIGDGILSVTYTIGAGVIKDIGYIVRTIDGKNMPLYVKDFNLTTGEMTIIVSNRVAGGFFSPGPRATPGNGICDDHVGPH